MTDARPVLVFDSGIGGLSVLREARVRMPERRFIYVADDAAFPYGRWPEAALRRHILQLFDALFARFDPAMCIVACNTAFTLAGADLRAHHPQRCFVGTVPAIKPAAARSRSRCVAVLATPGTVHRDYTHDLITRFAGGCRVQLVGSARLAHQAEAYIRGLPIDEALIAAEIAPCFVDEGGRCTDIVVLGCTHYPFLVNVFRRLAPWPVDWLDPAEAIARHARSLLPQGARAWHPDEPDSAWFTSGTPDFVTSRLLNSFGLQTGAWPPVAAAPMGPAVPVAADASERSQAVAPVASGEAQERLVDPAPHGQHLE